MKRASPSTITAVLIDPVAAEAQIVSLKPQDGELVLAELHRLIGCDLVERAPLDDQHLIWTDEEGWDCATGLTVIDDGVNAIAGRFLVIGATPDGKLCNVTIDLAHILARFACHRCIFEPEFEMLSGDTPASFLHPAAAQGNNAQDLEDQTDAGFASGLRLIFTLTGAASGCACCRVLGVVSFGRSSSRPPGTIHFAFRHTVTVKC